MPRIRLEKILTLYCVIEARNFVRLVIAGKYSVIGKYYSQWVELR